MRHVLALVALSMLVASTPARAGDGNLDLGFGTLGVVNTTIGLPNFPALAIQPDDRILVTGRTPTQQPLVARLDGTGAFDPTFGAGGIASVAVGGNPHGLAVQPDGRILVAGTVFSSTLLARLDATGAPDPTFGSGGIVTTSFTGQDGYSGMALDPAGKVVAVGTGSTGGYRLVIGRHLLSDGSLDPTFGAGGTRIVSIAPSTLGGSIVRQPDGKLVVGGSVGNAGPVLTLSGFVMRLDEAGSPDGAFATGGVATFDFGSGSDTVEDIALQPDGRIVAVGTSSRKFVVVRYTPDGMLDPTFGNGAGYALVGVGALDSGRALVLQPDGKIVVVGYTFTVIGQPSTGRWVVLRLLPDGTLDPSFGDGGKVVIGFTPGPGIAYAGARQSDGKLVVAGLNGSTTTGPLAVVRLGGDCGDGAVAGLETCDDGNAVPGDCCDLACRPEPALQACPNAASGCVAPVCDGAGGCGIVAPASGCKQAIEPRRSTLALKDGAADQLAWKYRKGDATALEDLGDPYVGTDYTLCGYGPDLGSGPTLQFELNAPAGGLCAGRACWSLLGQTGFTYRDRERTPTGLDLLRVRSGPAGRVSLVAKGKGSTLELPSLPLALPARVQLRASDGACWETTFSSAGVLRNDASQFRGKAD